MREAGQSGKDLERKRGQSPGESGWDLECRLSEVTSAGSTPGSEQGETVRKVTTATLKDGSSYYVHENTSRKMTP